MDTVMSANVNGWIIVPAQGLYTVAVVVYVAGGMLG